MKRCTKCGQTKTEECFPREKKGRDGLSSRCQACHAAYAKAYAQTERGKRLRREAFERYKASEHGKAKRLIYSRSEKMAAVRKAWSKTEAGRAAAKKYRASPKRKAVLRRYYESGKGRAAIDRYQQTPKGRESLLRGVHKRRAAMSLTICDLTAAQWQAIQGAQCGECAICGKKAKLTRDHIVPLSKGGQHTATNIQGLCRSCNSRKGNR